LYDKNDVSVNLEKYQYNHCDAYFSKETLCLKKIDAFFLLQKNNLFANEIHIELENVRNIIIVLYEIKLGEKYKIDYFTFDKEENNNIIIINYSLFKDENILDYVIQFQCNETLDNNCTYIVKSIKIV